ncbi:sugar phosphate isomerase/epimerase [bacterium]|nr:sugar phosphate isomerase/epimerase [bacterium]
MATFNPITRRGFLGQAMKLGAASLLTGHVNTSSVRAAPERPKGSEWRIGCYTRPWGKYHYRTALDAIAEAGFEHAGLMTSKSKTGLVISVGTTLEEARQVGQDAKERGLQIPSVYGGDIPVHQSLQAAIDALRKLIDNCAVAAAKTLLIGGTGMPELYGLYYKAIAECCDYAAEKRVGITLKPHGGLNATGPQCRKAIEKVGHKNFTLWYDPGNIYYYSNGQLDPVTDAATVDGLVTGMCVKDYRHPKNVLVTPGTGKVNFRAVLARLKKGGFTHGPLVIETLAPGGLDETLEQAKKARKFVREVTS